MVALLQWILCVFSFIIGPLESLTRYTSDIQYVSHPLPLDVCIQLDTDYVIYSCDIASNPHILTKANHTSYAACNSPQPIQSNQTQNGTAPLFNCIGQNNYVVLHQFESEQDCDEIDTNNNYSTSYIATNVCHNQIHYSCNEYFTRYNLQCDTYSQVPQQMYISRTSCNSERRIMIDCIENDDSILYNESISVETDDLTLLDFYFTINNYTKTTNNCSFGFNATRFLEHNTNTNAFCGIQLDDDYYITSIQFENMHLYHGLPSSVCNLQRLSVLSIRYQNIEDNLHALNAPQCISTDLPLLRELMLVNTKLEGSIDSILERTSDTLIHLYLENNPFMTGSIASNVCNLTTFHIVDMPQMDGVIPECVFSEDSTSSYSYFHIVSTALSGNIPHSICNTRLLSFRLHDNPSMTGSIPNDCEDTKLLEFTLIAMNGLRGRIPEWVFCDQALLEWMDIRNMMHLITQQVPSCFSETKPFLETFIISKTSFNGVLPALPFSLHLEIINIAYNEFEGTFADLFANYMMINSAEIINDLWCILMHDNNFASVDDLSETLQFLWNQWNIELFSIANNPNVTGELPAIQTDAEYDEDASTESIFMAHNCDIYGVIPDIQMARNLKWFTLFDNRLSGAIPEDIGDVNSTALTPLILTGNILYSTNSDSLPLWMSSSPFSTASNLYNAAFQQIISLGLLCISVFAVIVTIFSQIKHWKAKKANVKAKKAKKEERDPNPFFGRIEFVHWKYGSFGMLFWIVFLLIFYPICASYYQDVKLESLFTLNWYSDNSKWVDGVLCLASIGFQLVILNMAVKVFARTNEFNEDESQIVHSDSIINPENAEDTTKFRKCCQLFVFFLNVLIYIAGVAVICSYFVIQSLPADNMLHINESIASVMSKSMALFLMLFNKYSIRNLVHAFVKWRQYDDWYRVKQKWIIIIHIMNCVVIPFIAGVVFLQNCGKHWVLFWNRCNDRHLRQIFDVSVDVITDRYSMEFDVLSSSDICDTRSVFSTDMKWSKCIRSFFYSWFFVIFYKVVYEIIGSLLGLFWRLLKLKLCPCFKKNRKWRLDIGNYNIKFITNLIISITFAFYSPLIIAVYLMGVILIKYLHKVMKNRYGMTLHSPCNINDTNFYYLPVHLMSFGVFFNQCIVLLFLSFCVYNLFPATMFVVSTLIMDYAVVKNIRKHNQVMRNKEKEVNPSIDIIEEEKKINKKEAKKMLNISRKRLSEIHEDEEQFDDEEHIEIIANNDTQLELKEGEETETDMKSYNLWVREMREKMKHSSSNSVQSVVSSNGTPVPHPGVDHFMAPPNTNMHQMQESASFSQHYSIELSTPNEKSAQDNQDV